MSPHVLPAAQAFGWGAVGGSVAAVVVYVLPVVASGAIRGSLNITTGRLFAMLAIVATLSVVAGVFALVPHFTSMGNAIEYGLGVNGVIKGITEAGKDAIPERQVATSP